MTNFLNPGEWNASHGGASGIITPNRGSSRHEMWIFGRRWQPESPGEDRYDSSLECEALQSRHGTDSKSTRCALLFLGLVGVDMTKMEKSRGWQGNIASQLQLNDEGKAWKPGSFIMISSASTADVRWRFWRCRAMHQTSTSHEHRMGKWMGKSPTMGKTLKLRLLLIWSGPYLTSNEVNWGVDRDLAALDEREAPSQVSSWSIPTRRHKCLPTKASRSTNSTSLIRAGHSLSTVTNTSDILQNRDNSSTTDHDRGWFTVSGFV